MNKVWISIKAVMIVVVGLAIFAIMSFTTLVYGIFSGLSKMKVTKGNEQES